MKKVLITGASGFAGSHLAEYLLSLNRFSVVGTYLAEKSLSLIPDLKDKMEFIQADLSKKEEIERVVSEVKPDYVYHLAALASPADSFKAPDETFINNTVSQIHLLESIRNNNLTATRILVISSADVYGKVSKEDLPITEKTRFMPTNPYAVSKIAQDFLGLQYFLSYDMHIVRVRPFNHIGPRQSPHFAVSAFAKKVAEIEKGKMEPVLRVGNLEPKRDFTDVRDTVRAYQIILDEGKDGEVYNIGSGVSYALSDVVDKFLSFSTVKMKVEVDPELFRPSDTPELLCDYQKLHALTNWKPTIPFDQTLKETLDYWRNIV